MKIVKLQPKTKKKIHILMRIIVQLGFFLFLPSVFTTAFSGIKYIFTKIGVTEPIELTSFVSVLMVLCLYTIIFGRFFCGFACAFGSLGDWIHAFYKILCKKMKKRPVTIKKSYRKYLSYIKYMILAIIVILCFNGLYGKTSGWSPWEVFSMIHAGNLKLGGYMAGIILLVLIVIGMAVCERFFCRFLCPMGAVFSLLPVLPFFALCRDRSQCITGCAACSNQCPSDIELSEEKCGTGDCFMCQKCMDVCPKGNIRGGDFVWKGNEIWFILFRAAVLVILLIYAGI